MRPDERGVGREHPAQDGLRRSLHGRNRGDAEALVQVGPRGVVDAGHHVFDVKNLTCDARGNNVRVITRGHRREGVRVFDVGLTQAGPVHADPRDPAAGKIGGQARKGLGILVNNGHGMTRRVER